MATDRTTPLRETPALTLSGRARTSLQQYQRRIDLQQRELQRVERVLSGALTACDASSQHEMLASYLEALQELRVSLQRLEGFLMQRLGTPALPLGAKEADEDANRSAAG